MAGMCVTRQSKATSFPCYGVMGSLLLESGRDHSNPLRCKEPSAGTRRCGRCNLAKPPCICLARRSGFTSARPSNVVAKEPPSSGFRLDSSCLGPKDDDMVHIWVYGKGAQLWAGIMRMIQGTDYSLLAKPDLRTSRRNFLAAASTLATAGILWAGLGVPAAKAGNGKMTGCRLDAGRLTTSRLDATISLLRNIIASSPEPASRHLTKKSPSTNFASAIWS